MDNGGEVPEPLMLGPKPQVKRLMDEPPSAQGAAFGATPRGAAIWGRPRRP